MVSGTIIAVVPIAVPINNLVKGNKNTTKRMNGMERPMSMILFKIKFAIREGNNPPGLVSLTKEPSGKAMTHEIIKETKDMYKVSIVASNISFISFTK